MNNPSKTTVSVPKSPFSSFIPELPLNILLSSFPLASISKAPVNVIFSMFWGRVYEIEVIIKSVPSPKFSLTVSDTESIIYVSSPAPPINKSLPFPPLMILFEEFPVIVSLPDPPTAFSIIVPAEIVRFPSKPAILEVKIILEFFSVDLKSIF